jgi:hypothetical protein
VSDHLTEQCIAIHFLPYSDNPNIPFGYFEKNTAFFWPTRGGEGQVSIHLAWISYIPISAQRSSIFEDIGMYRRDPGPSWKKWEDDDKKEE